MNNMSFMIWFSVYACAMITLGWYVSRKQKTGEDFLLGGRSLPMILTLGSTVGTMVGTGSSVGAVGFGYSNGWAGMLYGLGGAVGILLVAWLFAPVRKLRFMTMSEEMSYYTGGSKIIKNLVAILIFIASIGWLGAHILGGGLYLAWASGIDINVAKIIIALAFVVYVGIGGYSAVVWIDTIQSIVLFVGFILMAILAVHHVGGWSHIQQAVDPAAQSLFAVDKLGVLPALSLAMVIGVGVLATPSYRQRIYSAKTVSSVRQSFTITGLLYLGFSFLPAIIGMAVWTMNPQLENSGFAFLFATQVLPPVLAMAILIAGMSANMSSGSSDAIAAVSIMLRDLYTLVTGHMPAPEKAIRLSRIFLVLVIALALLFALTSNDIIRTIMMNIIRLYIYPLFLGFVIVPLLVWPMVVALAACIITLSFLGEMLFSIPLMIRRISLLQLQLWLSAEYALFFCVMCCVGWQFTRRTQSELKSRLHCWLVFAPVYLWLILWNIIFYIAPAKIALLESIRNFFLLVVWLPLNFSPFWPQPWTDFIGPISAQLGFALGYYCQWRSKNRCQIRKLSEWGTCLSFVTLGMMAWALR